MKRSIIVFVTALSFAACTNSGKKSENVNLEAAAPKTEAGKVSTVDNGTAPRFKFEQDSYDFGQIKEGEKVSYDFKFKNVGKSPLIIKSATATCGCTIPEYPKAPIEPGGEGIIHVIFNSDGKQGMQNKVISIVSNTEPSLTEVHLMGDVKPKNK